MNSLSSSLGHEKEATPDSLATSRRRPSNQASLLLRASSAIASGDPRVFLPFANGKQILLLSLLLFQTEQAMPRLLGKMSF